MGHVPQEKKKGKSALQIRAYWKPGKSALLRAVLKTAT